MGRSVELIMAATSMGEAMFSMISLMVSEEICKFAGLHILHINLKVF